MADILHLIKINDTREKAYQAIAAVEGVRNWWTRDADLDTRLGGRGEFRFANGKRVTKVEIEELKPSTRVAWKVLSAPIPTWAKTIIEFELNAEDGGTALRFAHRGFEHADDLFAYSATAWAYFLVSLKEYLETGKGMPHPDDVFSRDIKP
ncbi:MAG TPA: SRPBCC domain-containing protein [Gammaproteobacteria bacterium]|nr:SRPBCC domain-containing protein [Gammaproteobacteria bacterium]